MAAPVESDGGEQRMPSFWLPPRVRGNGLDADRWARIAAVAEEDVTALLDAFASAGVPARADPPVSARARSRAIAVYVDPLHYARAENVLLRHRAGPRSIARHRHRE